RHIRAGHNKRRLFPPPPRVLGTSRLERIVASARPSVAKQRPSFGTSRRIGNAPAREDRLVTGKVDLVPFPADVAQYLCPIPAGSETGCQAAASTRLDYSG